MIKDSSLTEAELMGGWTRLQPGSNSASNPSVTTQPIGPLISQPTHTCGGFLSLVLDQLSYITCYIIQISLDTSLFYFYVTLSFSLQFICIQTHTYWGASVLV